MNTKYRPGRYTGPSLQVAPEAPDTRTHAQKCQEGRDKTAAAWCAAQTAKIKQTRAEIARAKNDKAIADLRAVGGIVAYGAWSTGAGNFKSKRSIPLGAYIYKQGAGPAHVQAWFATHPRALRCVAILEVTK